jgi:hypothetical protein
MKKSLFTTLIVFIFALTYGQDKVYTPIPLLPVNNAVDQMVKPLLDWTAIAGAQTYELQYDTDVNFSNPAIVTTGLSAAYLIELNYFTQYYWRVRAIGSAPSDVSSWSTVWSFTTKDKPNLVLPKDVISATPPFDTLKYTYDISTFFKWQKILGSSDYIIEVDTDLSFPSPLEFSTADVDSTIIDLEYYGQGYYYRIKALHSQDTSFWSDINFFSTKQKPVLEQPNPSQTSAPHLNVSPIRELQWDGILGSEQFQYEYSVDSTFATSTIIDVPFSALTILNPNNIFARKAQIRMPADTLPYGEKIFWRARSLSASDTSMWSEPFWLTTIATVNLSAPLSGAVNVNVTPVMTWSRIAGSLEYQLQISKQSDFSDIVRDTIIPHPTGSGNNVSITLFPKLDGNTLYYWRVRAISSRDISAWQQSSFTTQSEASIPSFNPESSFNFYPNPTTGKLNIEIQVPQTNTYKIEISNIIGQIITEKTGTLNSGENKINMNINEFDNGIYFLTFHIDKQKITKKVILSK